MAVSMLGWNYWVAGLRLGSETIWVSVSRLEMRHGEIIRVAVLRPGWAPGPSLDVLEFPHTASLT